MKPVIIRVPSARTRIVATRSVGDHVVVAHGRSLRAVMKKAAKAGAKEPALMFVPRANTRYIYRSE